jgi:DNA-directed RNA polymerase specialized sigma24 family protein
MTASPRDVEHGELLAQMGWVRRLAGAVMVLEEPYRSAVLLHYLDGFRAPEVAARTGVTHAAVRKRISRGLEKLRERFDSEHGQTGTPGCRRSFP